MAYKRGVYVDEQATSLQIPVQSTAGLQVIFGTAPVHLAKNPYACANAPILANTFVEAAEKLGYSDDFDKYTLCQSVDACFRAFAVAPIVLVNVLDPTVHVKDLAETEIAVKDGAAVLAADGVLLDKLTVKAGQTTLAAKTDYTAAFDAAGHPVLTLAKDGAGASTAQLTVSGKCIDPSAVTEAEIIGGVDTATGRETGLEVLRQIYPRLSMTPGLLLAPGWSHKPTVAVAMQAKCASINGAFSCECILDVDTTVARTYDSVLEAKQAMAATSPRALAVWPKAAIGSKVYYLSALYGPATAANDAKRNDVPAVSASNKELPITALVGADGAEIHLDMEQANTVCGFGVATALNSEGSFKTWGNNTAAYPGNTDPKDRFFCIRRFFSWWGNSFIRTYLKRVDDPTNFRLVESVCDSENVRGNSLVARGYCAGARIEYRANENTAEQLLDGKIRFHQYLTPYPPAECIMNTLEFDPSALMAEMGG